MNRESKLQYEIVREIDFGEDEVIQQEDDLNEEATQLMKLVEAQERDQKRLEENGDIEYDEDHQILHSFNDLDQGWDNEGDPNDDGTDIAMSMAERGHTLLFG